MKEKSPYRARNMITLDQTAEQRKMKFQKSNCRETQDDFIKSNCRATQDDRGVRGFGWVEQLHMLKQIKYWKIQAGLLSVTAGIAKR